MNIYEKIQAVTNEINNITKDMNVNNQYKAVSDLAVTLAVNRAEAKFKIISIPIKQELINSDIYRNIDTMDYVAENTTNGTKQTNVTNTVKTNYVETIKMTVRFIDMENPESFVDVESFGRGLDSGDKGFGKASTYARKYALLNAYKIPTGEDPDKDASPDHDKKQNTTPAPAAKIDPQPNNEAPKEAFTEITNSKTIEELGKIALKYRLYATDTKFVLHCREKETEIKTNLNIK